MQCCRKCICCDCPDRVVLLRSVIAPYSDSKTQERKQTESLPSLDHNRGVNAQPNVDAGGLQQQLQAHAAETESTLYLDCSIASQ